MIFSKKQIRAFWKPCRVMIGLALSMGIGQAQQELSTQRLKQMSLEELMNIDITTLSKTPQRIFQAAAAAQVITGEEIRRSGASSLPEALRLSTSLNVARVNAREWVISARGFATTTSNKLLVLIDGRSVYTTLYSGVFWDVQDVLMEDIDRIEVIAGPGGTLWGTNAVNGIINIITKSSRTTSDLPLYVEVGGGTAERFSGALRYGGSLGASGSYRTYVKYFNHGSTSFENSNDAKDSWNGAQGGARADFDLSSDDVLSMQGDVYDIRANQFSSNTASMKGGNLNLTWNHELSENSSLRVRSYFDYSHRRLPEVFGEDLRVFDHEAEHRTRLGNHELTWGVGLRHGNSSVINSQVLAFLPAFVVGERYSGFIQDEINISGRVQLILGSKFTKGGSSSRIYVQPRVSISWSPAKHDFAWVSATSAVRTPSRIDRSYFIPGVPPYVLAGGPDFVAEKLLAFEAGYRRQLNSGILVDVSLFYNLYDDLRSVEPESTYYVIKNGLEARTFGGEVNVTTAITDWWNVRMGYSHLQKFIDLKAGSNDLNGGRGEGNDHKHRLVLHSSMNIMSDWEVDVMFRFVDELPNSNAVVPSYATADLRLGWVPIENLRVSVLVENIFTPYHVEFGGPVNRERFGREVFGRISLAL